MTLFLVTVTVTVTVQKQDKNLVFQYGGIDICALTTVQIAMPSLFSSLPASARPVAAKSRRFNKEDQEFIDNEVSGMLSKGIIEPCYSPWRAQLVVAKDRLNQHKETLY